MPIDSNIEAASLVAQTQEISPVEQQNRFGMRHQRIPDLPSGKFVTVLTIQTPQAFTTEQFFEILTHLQTNYGVEGMQTAFACTIPTFGDKYQNDLHLTAHLRAESRPDDPSP